MKKMIFVVLIILVSIMWVSSPMYGKIPDRYREALLALYRTTNGENWSNRTNKWGGAPETENTWYGITCDPANTKVLRIDLKDNNLKGTLPAELGDLSDLQSLVLSSNHLTGIHKELGKLSNLTILDLSNNQLTGSVPSWIGNLKNLKKLNLSNNRLTGAIPSWIGKLKHLEELLLDSNRLEGAIPKELGNLSKLRVLRIGHNRLTGKIPATIRKLTRLADEKSNFKWNGLYTDDASLSAFLKKKQTGRDWESTQTIAPGDITAVSPSKTSIIISWKPISYTADSGGYRVYYSAAPGGPYDKPGGEADDKTASELEVHGLTQSTTYYFVVQTWTDSHGSNWNAIKSKFSKEVSVTTRGITISGSVTTSGGQGVPGVEMKASNNGGSTGTDSKGNYNLGVTPRWSGTVTPSKKGYDLDPINKEYTDVNADLPDQNYTAEANTKISGRITNLKGNGVPGVTLTFSNKDGTALAETNSTGNYSHTVTYDWAGTVTPTKAGYKFDPLSRQYTGVTSAAAEEKYKASKFPEISGRIKNRRGRGIADVTLTFTDREGIAADTRKTDKQGKYSKVFISDWSGSAIPEKSGYIFYPAKGDYENMTIDTIELTDYKAELDLKFFISVTGNYMIPSEEGFSDSYGSGIFDPEIKAGYKFSRTFYIWGGYSFSSQNSTSSPGDDPDIQTSAKWQQKFFSLGLGYNRNISFKFGWKAEVGVVYVNCTEEMSINEKEKNVFSDKESGKTMGVRIGGSGIFKISDRLFTEISVGYLFASFTINDRSIKLGGLKTGVGFGLRF